MSTNSLPRDKEQPSRTDLEDASPSAIHEFDSPQHFSLWRTVVVILSLCAGTLLVAIDTTIISVAIPSIATDFVAFHDVGWYGSAYLFTVTAFQPAFGSIYRFFDAKWTYLTSIVLFEGVYFCVKTVLASELADIFISWIGPMCCCSDVSCLHFREERSRPWSCWLISRRTCCDRINYLSRQKANDDWNRVKRFRPCRVLWPASRWRPDRPSDLAMVFLDVS